MQKQDLQIRRRFQWLLKGAGRAYWTNGQITPVYSLLHPILARPIATCFAVEASMVKPN